MFPQSYHILMAKTHKGTLKMVFDLAIALNENEMLYKEQWLNHLKKVATVEVPQGQIPSVELEVPLLERLKTTNHTIKENATSADERWSIDPYKIARSIFPDVVFTPDSTTGDYAYPSRVREIELDVWNSQGWVGRYYIARTPIGWSIEHLFD